MAETSPESQSIKELTKTVREERERSRAADEERAKRYSGKTAEQAKERIRKADEQLAIQRKRYGLSKKQVEKSGDINGAIEKQKEIMEAQKAELSSLGINAEDNKKFQKEERKLAKMELAAAKASGSKEAEAEAKKKLSDMKSNTFLGKIANGIGGILQGTKEKIKGGLSGFKKFAFGALAIAALAFLNNPKFEEIKKTILDVVIPAVAYLYDEIIKPIALYIGGKLKNLFVDLKSYIDGEKGIGTVLMDNIGVVSAIVLALGVKVLGFSGMLTAVKGIGTALLWVAKGGPITLITNAVTSIKAAFITLKTFLTATAFPAITAKLVAIKAFFITTLAPFLASAMGFLLPIIGAVAVIGTLFYALKQGFDDFMFELEATGSVWEAVKTGIISVISNLFGFPLNLIKSGVSYILEKIGSIFGIDSFIDASKAMDDFSFVDFFKDSLTSMGDYIAGLFDAAINFLKEKGRKILKFVGLDKFSDRLFGTKEEDDAKRIAKEEEKRQLEEQRIALREQKRLEEKEKEAAKIAEAKKREEAMALKVDQSNASNRQKMIARRAETQAAAPAPSIFNAPTTVSAPSTTNVTSTSTALSNNDRVIDNLSYVT